MKQYRFSDITPLQGVYRMTTNAERLKKYRANMEANGFKRLSFYASAELCELIRRERQPSECGGRVLERLLLGKAAKRPDYWTRQEKVSKQAKRQAFRAKFIQSP